MNRVGAYYPEGHKAHFEPGHPERPERIQAIRSRLEADGLWARLLPVQAAPLPDDLLYAIHTPQHIQRLEAVVAAGGRSDEDTYLTPSSLVLARETAGGATALAQRVWDGEITSGFALCRPPGHHATPNQAMGFCILNNVALAAQALLNRGARRLAIVDLDLHHGNGTQEIFYRRGEVAFVSIHEWPLYPGTGTPQETGQDDGVGFNMNIPLPPFSGDAARDTALAELIVPFMERVRPEMLLISLGLDAHWRDPLGYQVASTTGYAHILGGLREWAKRNIDGRMALFLEGGYDLEADADIAAAAVRVLLGEDWEDRLGPSPRPESSRWQGAVDAVRAIWQF